MSVLVHLFGRWAALAPLLFAALMLYLIRRELTNRCSPLPLRLINLLGCTAGLVASLVLAYHIAMGLPIQTGPDDSTAAPRAPRSQSR